MTLWDIITGNSTLPVQSGNTFWDHLNNQSGGGDLYITGVIGTKAEIKSYSIPVAEDSLSSLVKIQQITILGDNDNKSVLSKIDEYTI